jgi:uncharacterized protein YdcH (DUF465 family)
MDENQLKQLLLSESPEFKKIYTEHQACEKKLDLFKTKSFLTEEEMLEEKEVKKQKLSLKDRMYRLMAEYRKSR